MKKIYYLFASLLAFGMVACGGSDDPKVPDNNGGGSGNESSDDVEVKITTATIEFKANVLTEFGSQHKMNIYPKTYSRIDAPNIVDGVCATYDGNTWTMSPSVKINSSQKNAFVYAVSPYDASYTNASAIPIDMNKQIDLMYSGSYVPASLTTPTVKLTMNHALSLLTFNIVPINCNGGTLKNIKIDGENVYTTGTMDASTGKVTLGSTGAVSAAQNKAIADGGWTSDLPGIWALPFNTKAGDVTVTFTIDNKTYDLILPETEMKYGYQYIYRLTLTQNGLEFDPSMTDSRSLNVDTDETPEFALYGMITVTASGSWMHSPYFHGNAVFGSIVTPSKTISYNDSSVTLEGLSSGNTILVETWNSTGFEIESLDGIDVIDMTQYE